jgi:hypothetical protein
MEQRFDSESVPNPDLRSNQESKSDVQHQGKEPCNEDNNERINDLIQNKSLTPELRPEKLMDRLEGSRADSESSMVSDDPADASIEGKDARRRMRSILTAEQVLLRPLELKPTACQNNATCR